MRTLGQRHFDVQIMGGAALHFGWVAEMKTGEGKTLVATLPSYLNALAGRGVHLVTVNDYLAKSRRRVDGRSCTGFLGLEVGMVIPDRSTTRTRSAPRTRPTSPTARTTSSASTTSATTWSPRASEQVQRGPLRSPSSTRSTRSSIDEARTPLIISGRADDAAGALLPVRRDRAGPPARPRLRGRRGEAHRRAHRGRHRPRRAGARRRRTSTST